MYLLRRSSCQPDGLARESMEYTGDGPKGYRQPRSIGTQADIVTKQSRRAVTLVRSIQVLHIYSQVPVYMMVVSIVGAPGSLDGVQWVPWSLQQRQSVQDDCLRLVTVMDGKTGDESKRHRDPSVCCHEAVEASGQFHKKFKDVAS